MIGILGGTFDPIHNGHLHVATQVLVRLQPERVQLMPCAAPVHRAEPTVDASHRRAMIELAIAGRAGLELNPLELERGGLSFSVDSLRRLRREINGGLLFIMGSDAFNGFADWESPGEILTLAHLVVCHRPGQPPDPEVCMANRITEPERLRDRDAGFVLLLEIEPNYCSSSAVRAELARGEVPRDCLPAAVAGYIEQHRLYRNSSD